MFTVTQQICLAALVIPIRLAEKRIYRDCRTGALFDPRQAIPLLDSSVSMMEPAKDRMRNNVSESPDVEQRGAHFPARMGSSNRLGGPFGDVFIRAKFQ